MYVLQISAWLISTFDKNEKLKPGVFLFSQFLSFKVKNFEGSIVYFL